MVTFAEILKYPRNGGYWDIEEFNNHGEGFTAPDGRVWYLDNPEDVAELFDFKGKEEDVQKGSKEAADRSVKSLRQWLSRERKNHTQLCSGADLNTAIPGWKRQRLLLKLLKIQDASWLKLNASEFRTQWQEANSTLDVPDPSKGLRWGDIMFGDASGRGLQLRRVPAINPKTYEGWLEDRRKQGRLPPGNPQTRGHNPFSEESERPSFEGFANDATPVRLGQEDLVMTFQPPDGARCSGWTTTVLVRASPAPSPNRQVWSLLPRYALGKMKNPLRGYRERLDANGAIEISPIEFKYDASEIAHEYWVFVHQEGDLDKGRYATYFHDKFAKDDRVYLDPRLLNEWASWISLEQAAGRARWASCSAVPYWEGRSPYIDDWAERARRSGKG